MSLILDALKKSDQERQRRKTPGIHTLHGGSEPHTRSRALWPYLVLIALLLNAGLVLWWLHPWGSEKESDKQGKPPSQEIASAAKVESGTSALDRRSPGASRMKSLTAPASSEAAKSRPKPPKPAAAPPVRPPAARAIPAPAPPPRMATAGEPGSVVSNEAGPGAQRKDGPDSRAIVPGRPPTPRLAALEATRIRPAIKGTDRESAPPPASPPPAVPRPAPSVEVPRKALAPAPPPAPSMAVPSQTTAPGEALPDDSKLPRGDKSAAQRSGSPGSEISSFLGQAAEETKALPDLRELPVEIQRDLPDLSFSMLVFSNNPPDRMVGINGKTRHEGDEVADGLKVERITPTGAILNFRGHRFHKSVL